MFFGPEKTSRDEQRRVETQGQVETFRGAHLQMRRSSLRIYLNQRKIFLSFNRDSN